MSRVVMAALVRRALPLAVALAIAACGGPSPTQAPAASLEPDVKIACGLVQDMDTLVGRTAVAAPSSYTIGGRERCLWVYVSDPSRYVALTVGDASGHAMTIGSFGDGEVIEGLGDEARWWNANQTLSVLVDDRALQVDVQLDDVPAPRELATSIARKAVEGLP